MLQLICHLIGDYCFQNQWMANEKTKRWFPALVHAFLYTLPFLLVTQSWQTLAVIGFTHAVIDRYRLARLWVEFWGVGFWPSLFWRLWAYGPKPWFDENAIPPSGSQSPPPFLAVWLLIIVDNTIHLGINYAAILWL